MFLPRKEIAIMIDMSFVYVDFEKNDLYPD